MTEINEYRQDLKGKIVDYAMTQFYERGIKAVKMDEISVGLHVSKRTVYEIFGDKEELLLEGLKARQEEMRRKLETYASGEGRNVIDVLGCFYRLQMERNNKVGAQFYEEIHKYPRIVEFLECSHERDRADRMRFFEVGVREGLFRKDVDYELVSMVGHAALMEIMHLQLYKRYSMQQLFDNYFMLIIRGFCTEDGYKMLNKAIS